MAPCSFVHRPELVLFVLDMDGEMATEAVPGWSRFDAVVHAITTFVTAKKRLDINHEFALATITDAVRVAPDSVTPSADRFLSTLRALNPSGTHPAFDIGSLVPATEALRRRADASGRLLRVVLIYGRSSCIPTTQRSGTAAAAAAGATGAASTTAAAGAAAARGTGAVTKGVCVDCVYLHDKPVPGVNRPQAVYSALEDCVDEIAAAAGHLAYVFETSGSNVKKLLTLLAALLAHPLQRLHPQAEVPPPVDLGTAPLAPLPSERGSRSASAASPSAAAAAASSPSPQPPPSPGASGGAAAVTEGEPRYPWAAAALARGRPPSGGGGSGLSSAAAAAASAPPLPPGAQALASSAARGGGGDASRRESSAGSGSHPITDLLHIEDEEEEEEGAAAAGDAGWGDVPGDAGGDAERPAAVQPSRGKAAGSEDW